MKTIKTQQKPAKRARVNPEPNQKQLMQPPVSVPVEEVITPRQVALSRVCYLTGANKIQYTMQIAGNHLHEYCLMPDKEAEEFVRCSAVEEILYDCLAFGMLDAESRSPSDQSGWLLHFLKEYKKTKATLATSTRKKPNWDIWNAKAKVTSWQAAALSCDIDPEAIDMESIEDFLSPDLHEFRWRLHEYQKELQKNKLLQTLNSLRGITDIAIMHL
jgi:hypothetical protein